MARNRTRQANGTAWHCKFDDCWYATIEGKRTNLRDEIGNPIKGKDYRQQAELAVARVKLHIEPAGVPGDVLVATVCSAYLDHLRATACQEYHELASRTMNLSLAERPVWMPVRQTKAPPWLNSASPLARAIWYNALVVKFQYSLPDLAMPCVFSPWRLTLAPICVTEISQETRTGWPAGTGAAFC